MDLKNKFHFAKLSLFNIRLLNDFECSNSKDVEEIKTKRANLDNLSLPINLLHQSSFLSHAYVTLVWLWETIKQEKIEKIILEKIEKKYCFSDNIEIIKIGNSRKLDTSDNYLRLIRNAISHGNVNVTDDYFIFLDENPKNENDYGKIRMKWQDIGMLSDAILFSVNDYIYYNNEK